MKRILSFCVALCMLVTTFAFQACAEGEVNRGDNNDGYFGGNNQVGDDLSDVVVPVFNQKYAVAYNDFEGVTNMPTEPATYFKISDTGDESYNNALNVPARAWTAYSPGTSGFNNAKYEWNGQTFTMFAEPLTEGENYILSYDYKSYDISQANGSYAFRFVPMHNAFWYEVYNTSTQQYQDEYSYEPLVNLDGSWATTRIGFTATQNKVNIKSNTCSYKIGSYIDNYLVMQAAEIVVNDNSGFVNISSADDNVVVTPKSYGSFENTYMVQKGDELKLKVGTIDGAVTTVTYSGEPVQPDADGYYCFDKVTEDITVDVSVTKGICDSIITNSCNANGTDVYVQNGRTAYSYIDDINRVDGFSNTDLIKTINATGDALELNQKLTTGDKLYVEYGDTTSDTYNIKIAGDFTEDGQFTVADITAIIDKIVTTNYDDKHYGIFDYNCDGVVTVSDVVDVRANILGKSVYYDTRDTEVNIITASGVDLDFTELDNGIFNVGDQSALANVIRKAMNGEDIVIASFGGSITAEGNANNSPTTESGITTTLGIDSYSDYMLHWFEETFPNVNVTLVNAGIGATDTPLAIHRMYDDVINASGTKPDLVVYEWALNDGALLYKQGTFENGVRKFLNEDIAVMIFSFASHSNPGGQPLQEPISKFYNLPHLSYKNAFQKLSAWKYLSNDGVHPNKVGHALAGLLITRYLSSIYNNIDSIDTVVPEIPTDTYNPEANYYGMTYTYSIEDILAGSVEGVSVELGSFVKEDSAPYTYGNDADKHYTNIVSCHKSYSAYTAYQNADGEYDPMVITANNVKTAFILMHRFNSITECNYSVKVNGVAVDDVYDSFSCSIAGASDNIQSETRYHWASGRLCYNETPANITIEITPELGVYDATSGAKQKLVRLFGVLLSK